MVFGNITTLYFPTAANAGASQWGTDVRKVLDSADAGLDSTTINQHGTGGAVTRTADPYSTIAADNDEKLYGWAVTPADMNSVSGARRFYPAGDHVATLRMSQSAVAGAVVTVTMFVFRVGNAAGGRVRTLLGSGSATPTLAALNAISTVTITVTLAEIIFEPDETIQYEFETNVAGVAVTGRNVTFHLGTQGGVANRVDTPRLGVLKDFTGIAAGTSTAEATVSEVLGTVGVSAGTSTAAGALSAVGAMVGIATGTSTAAGALSAVAGTIGTAAGTSSADGDMGLILSTVGTATVGADCPADWTPNDGLKQIQGDVFFHEPPNQGDPVVGATVTLIRDSDGLRITDTLTDGAGHYSFGRDTNDPFTYHVEVNYTGPPAMQGLSEGGCVPV